MKKHFTKITTAAVGAALVAAALSFAAPAGAAGAYTPKLAPKPKSAARVAVTSIATFRPTVAVKRTTTVAKPATTVRSKPAASTASGTSELAQAKSILAGLIAQHPILKGTTVEFGDAHGYQAVAFYRSGRIVISKSHTASLKRILNHEVWHIIDYRDNGRIDWGENVPPR